MISEMRDTFQAAQAHNFACAHVTFPDISFGATRIAPIARIEVHDGAALASGADIVRTQLLTPLLTYTGFGWEKEAKRFAHRGSQD